jgi:hypothetical protein
MEERLLQFIWEYQYFNQRELATEEGESVRIMSPGAFNGNQGPDFLGASIRIGHTTWTGAIEIHVNRSDWKRHKHSGDPHYQPVILHVVWENDRTAGDSSIPLLVLKSRVSKVLLGKYREWMKGGTFIPCERQLAKVWPPVRVGFLEKLVEERLKRRAHYIRSCLEKNQGHWEETAWWLMARNFGLPVNGEAFESIARSIPYALLMRLRTEPVSLEALLLGQAGLLNNSKRPEGTRKAQGENAETDDGYPGLLRKEYAHLRLKYTLSPAPLPLLFLRMRPAHFPVIRLSQLGALFSRQGSWCALIREARWPGELDVLLSVHASPYWEGHYTMGKPSPFRVKALGEGMKRSLITNSFIPLLYAYGCLRGERVMREKALGWLRVMPAEKNAIITKWRNLGITAGSALDTQGLLELKGSYCGPKRCLDCAAGKVLFSGIL